MAAQRICSIPMCVCVCVCGNKGVIARCAAGGRDHTPCCNRRGVIPACISLCRGVLPSTPAGSDCLSYAGNILQCFEEGMHMHTKYSI